MPEEEYTPPDWMLQRAEKIGEAGGLTAYNLNKEAEETLKALSKVKPKTWKVMGETIETITDFVDSGVVGGLKDIGQDFKNTLSLQVEEALAPLSNQIDQALSDALAPIMPEIQAFTSEIASFFSLAIGSWKAIITGEWDDVLQDITNIMPDWFKQLKNDFNQRWYEMWNDIKSGNIGAVGDLPGVPLGAGVGFDIAQGIVNAWTSFWSDLGWR